MSNKRRLTAARKAVQDYVATYRRPFRDTIPQGGPYELLPGEAWGPVHPDDVHLVRLPGEDAQTYARRAYPDDPVKPLAPLDQAHLRALLKEAELAYAQFLGKGGKQDD